jgi:drug/metabolite transporter (DMT)-like permease
VLVALGIASAVFYGSADFAGAMATRRASAVSVVFWSQLIGVVVLVTALAVLDAQPTWPDLGWGFMAGAFGGAGMVLLYEGLASGEIGIVSPVTAVCAAVVPVLGGLLLGETLGTSTTVGVVVGVVAVGLLALVPPDVEHPHDRRRARKAIAMGMGAGVSFGLFFLALSRTGKDAGLWPLLGARAASLTLLAAVGLAGLGAPRRLRVARPAWWLLVVCGTLDMAANVSFLLAARHGPVGAVAVIVALAPAATVLLARLVLGERVRRLQAAGLLAGAAAVVLIALR